MKTALISGISGQDGSYLSELLLFKGYTVFGLERRVALQDQGVRSERLRGLEVNILPCDITNSGSVFRAVERVQPDEIYHLAAQSYVKESFDDPAQTMDTNINGTLNMLEAMRVATPKARFYFAGSSEMFGKVHETPQKETTLFHPRSPYGVSKVAGFYLTQNYRESYNLFACSGILFNHESPRRGKEFVTRKITDAIGKIKRGEIDYINLGNLDAKRDWGFAGDYVRAMWLMLQQDKPQDYVVSTDETHSVREFADTAFLLAGLDSSKYIRTDASNLRPAEVELLVGDSSKARKELGWKPEVNLNQLIEMMVRADL